MCDGVHPDSERHIYLIRHGHYNKDSDEKGLSEMGIQQADRLATHLIEIKVSPQHIWWSTQTRAVQTTAVIHKKFPMAIVAQSSKLNEGYACDGYPPPSHQASSEVCAMYLLMYAGRTVSHDKCSDTMLK